ncbi:hypothetical protein D3C85_1848340 [compost metagenome]
MSPGSVNCLNGETAGAGHRFNVVAEQIGMILTEPVQIRRQPILAALPGDFAIGEQPSCGLAQRGLQPLLDLRLA